MMFESHGDKKMSNYHFNACTLKREGWHYLNTWNIVPCCSGDGDTWEQCLQHEALSVLLISGSTNTLLLFITKVAKRYYVCEGILSTTTAVATDWQTSKLAGFWVRAEKRKCFPLVLLHTLRSNKHVTNPHRTSWNSEVSQLSLRWQVELTMLHPSVVGIE